MSKIVVTDFMAGWCSPCKMHDPIMEELKKKFSDEVVFVKIDVDENGALADKYQVRAVPTLVIEKDGNIVKRYVGVTNQKTLEKDIKDVLGSNKESEGKQPEKQSEKQQPDKEEDGEEE